MATPDPAALAEAPIEDHAVHSARMLEHAAEMIERGERLQASEKMWGAVAHRLIAIARARGWPYRAHNDAIVIARHIADKADNAQILDLFDTARGAHYNFYADEYDLDQLAERLARIRRRMPMLDEAHRALLPDLEMPSDCRYRNRHGVRPDGA